MKSFSHEGIKSTFGRLQKADEEFRSVSARSDERIRSAPCAKFTRRHKTDDVCIRVQTEQIHSHCPYAVFAPNEATVILPHHHAIIVALSN